MIRSTGNYHAFGTCRAAALRPSALLLCLALINLLLAPFASGQCEAKWRVFPEVGGQSRAIAMHSDGLANDMYASVDYAMWHWTSAGWEKMGADFDSLINTIVTYHGDIYITGSFQEYNGQPFFGLARWNGSDWETVGGGIAGQAFAAYVYDDKLYVGGNYFNINGQEVRGVIIWDGNTWSSTNLDFRFNTNSGFVTAFGEFEGKLVVGGNFYYNGVTEVKSIVIQENGAFHPLGGGLYSPGGTVMSIVEFQGQLYASGQIYAGNGAPAGHIARFNGTSWEGLGTGLTTPGFEMVIHDNKIIVVGQFETANSVPVNGVAAWDGNAWSSIGFDVGFHNAQAVCLGPSGELLIAGQFIHDAHGDGNFENYNVARYAEGKPEIYHHATGGTYCGGANILLFAEAFTDEASGPLTWGWSRDAEPLEDGATDHYSEILGAHTNAPLILHARAADSGFYQGVAYNDCGFSLTYTALVYVCVSDVNCDGVSDLSDFFDFFNAWDITNPQADIDGDGQVDLIDYFAFFNAFDVQC